MTAFSRLRDYWELTKPRLVSLTLWSTAAGLILSDPAPLHGKLLFWTLLGSGLAAAGSMSLNQWMERGEDSRMSRTDKRPLPDQRIFPAEALMLGILLSAAGCVLLWVCVNPLSAMLAFATVASYLAVYTPLKKRTPWCTVAGAVPGALPPLIGWAAVNGTLSFQAWTLFAIVFFWQMPHFYAISWFCRKDYESAEFKMLSVKDPSGRRVSREIFYYSLALIPVSLLPYWAGVAGKVYFAAALILSLALAGLSVLCLKQLDRYARLFFRSSLLYLTLIFILMVADKQ